nr:MAG TPA: hypothetical protein [Caudoviricetes sp.]
MVNFRYKKTACLSGAVIRFTQGFDTFRTTIRFLM